MHFFSIRAYSKIIFNNKSVDKRNNYFFACFIFIFRYLGTIFI